LDDFLLHVLHVGNSICW